MQRHEVASDTADIKRSHKLWREVQARRGCRDRTIVCRIDGLIVGPVDIFGVPAPGDIWRQWHLTYGSNRQVKVLTRKIECKFELTFIALSGNSSLDGAGWSCFARMPEGKPITLLQPFRWPRQCPPPIPIDALNEGSGDICLQLAAPSHAFEGNRDHTRIIEDERVARAQ
jgi:hypothetical protein